MAEKITELIIANENPNQWKEKYKIILKIHLIKIQIK